MRTFALFSVLFIVGCETETTETDEPSDSTPGTETEDSGSGSETDSGEEAVEVDYDAFEITQVRPRYGVNTGGEDIFITGGPFPPNPTVMFANIEAEVITANQSVITVQLPEIDGSGVATVSVAGGSEGGRLEDAYLILEEGTGKAGALGVIRYSESTDSAYWAEPFNSGSGGFLFVQPVDFHWWQFLVPEMDSCAKDYENSTSVFALNIDQDELRVRPESGVGLDFVFNPDSFFYDIEPFGEEEYEEDSRYRLDTIDGGFFAGEGVQRLFRTGAPIQVESPAIQDDFPPLMSENQIFRWEPQGFAWVEISLVMLNETSTGVAEEVTCIVEDDGYFAIGSGLFSEWPPGRQINVVFGGARETRAPLVFNNSESRVAAVHRIIGAAQAR